MPCRVVSAMSREIVNPLPMDGLSSMAHHCTGSVSSWQGRLGWRHPCCDACRSAHGPESVVLEHAPFLKESRILSRRHGDTETRRHGEQFVRNCFLHFKTKSTMPFQPCSRSSLCLRVSVRVLFQLAFDRMVFVQLRKIGALRILSTKANHLGTAKRSHSTCFSFPYPYPFPIRRGGAEVLVLSGTGTFSGLLLISTIFCRYEGTKHTIQGPGYAIMICATSNTA